MWESVPFRFPIGLRTASTISAAVSQGGIPRLYKAGLTWASCVTDNRRVLRKNAKVELLKRVPLFENCSKRELGELATLADELTLPEGRELTREGASGKEFVVIVEGTADVRRKGRKVTSLRSGDFLGEIALVTGAPRTATVTATSPGTRARGHRAGLPQPAAEHAEHPAEGARGARRAPARRVQLALARGRCSAAAISSAESTSRA